MQGFRRDPHRLDGVCRWSTTRASSAEVLALPSHRGTQHPWRRCSASAEVARLDRHERRARRAAGGDPRGQRAHRGGVRSRRGAAASRPGIDGPLSREAGVPRELVVAERARDAGRAGVLPMSRLLEPKILSPAWLTALTLELVGAGQEGGRVTRQRVARAAQHHRPSRSARRRAAQLRARPEDPPRAGRSGEQKRIGSLAARPRARPPRPVDPDESRHAGAIRTRKR